MNECRNKSIFHGVESKQEKPLTEEKALELKADIGAAEQDFEYKCCR